MKSFTRDRVLYFFIILTILSGIILCLHQSVTIVALFLFSLICLGVVLHDINQTKHALLRNYPLVGRLRWVFEHERSKIQQYFIENDINGTPYNREKRSDIYQKAKADINTTPFGTQLDVYAPGYEFAAHSMYPTKTKLVPEPRVIIGSNLCKKPYSASIFNISAMSYGALSDAAIRALNGGAKLGNFYHNTGEGGLSPYHLENGGDLCYQIGTGYFGCGKTIDGERVFDETSFKKTISSSNVKMVELKLSQGAKPGHGGILPASKNTEEIAAIRGIEPNVDIVSPPYHSAFHDAHSLLNFIYKLRFLSNGLPIGIKLCIGKEKEFEELVSAMYISEIYPDFITVDGGEGGTGAAPLIFTNSVGMPLNDALKFVNKTLIENDIRNKIIIIASGKASTSFDIIKLISLGADVVNAARAFMFSMGCIQARECNLNTCPVGIATQNKELIKGLNQEEKKVRVFNYHAAVIKELRELTACIGKQSVYEVTTEDIIIRKQNGLL